MATLPNPLPRLATDPSGRSVGLALPPGRLVGKAPTGEPLLWHAEKTAGPGTWKALGRPAARAGLLPVLLELGGAQGAPSDWELMPEHASYPGDHDAEDVLTEYWADLSDEEWPGFAPDGTPTADPDTRATVVADALTEDSRFARPHLALVPARRSADIPAVLGWSGPLNHDDDVARLCAVLRSWEDRYGIRVVGLGFDHLTVSVGAPPTTAEAALTLAAEHGAFCPDVVEPDSPADLAKYAETLPGATSWTFWWD
ncbi:DUF4253 domain-containing protein [Streptomyces sp. J2-1]|uniref:DUF4253 domain-containing protein n=1 Tax=Streptomyces corallincola TaxID=2851888 RepID=UPI001C38E34F|nr:DUF4253 domain-containing protein [Streptomyces corallincola]MBV2354969.1 DUF4253 domain-containing protein [Streptomyces corallincola]